MTSPGGSTQTTADTPRSDAEPAWLLATADIISGEPPEAHRHLLDLAARRIHATFSVPHEQRLAATRFLFARVVTID